MLNKLKLKKSQEGFTIIEVMIVLAVAALILLIVLLAVPALQRNSRNTSRKNDVAALASGVNEYVTNNQGTLPGTCSGTTTPVTWGGATNTVSNTSVGYYNQGCAQSATTPQSPASAHVYLVTAPTSYPTVSTAASQDWVYVFEGTTCNSTGTAPATGGSRSFAMVYQIETGASSYAEVCTAS